MKTITLISDDYQGHVDYVRHTCRGIIIKDNQILLCYETKENKYIIPGGGVENNETLLKCLKREIQEETGYIIKANKPFLTIKEYFYWNKNWEHIHHYFICEVKEKKNTLSLTKTEQEVGLTTVWLTISKAIEIFSSYNNYANVDIATYGLYKRELNALNEYINNYTK